MKFFTPNIRKFVKNNNIPELLKCLEHKSADVRYSAFVALSALVKDPGNQIMNNLRNMVHDPDPWVKTVAILKFAEMGDSSISDNLMEIIIEGSRNARIELLKIITERGASDDQAIMEVIINAFADKQEIVRRNAIIAAGATGNMHLVPYLAESLHEKQHALRICAAGALCKIGGDDTVDYLISLLADKNQEVQAEARTCLAASQYDYAQKALHDTGFIQLIQGMNDREPIRRKTVQKIRDETIREGLPLLYRACKDKYKGVRVEALKAIAVFKNPSSIDFVAKLLYDKYRDVRLEAVNTLEQIADVRALKALESAFNDRDRHVNEAAQRSYNRLKRSVY